jgi:hypothetical protein
MALVLGLYGTLKLLKNNEQITMLELSKQIKKKYKDFNITPPMVR